VSALEGFFPYNIKPFSIKENLKWNLLIFIRATTTASDTHRALIINLINNRWQFHGEEHLSDCDRERLESRNKFYKIHVDIIEHKFSKTKKGK